MQHALQPGLREAAQRRGDPEPCRQRSGRRVHGRVGESPGAPYGGQEDDPGAAARLEHEPPVAGPAQHPVETADPLHVEPHPAAHGAGQAGREVDLGVLGPALLGHQRVALGEGETVGLLLEVVEQVEEPLFPAHPRTLAGRRRRVNRLWTNG